MNQYFVLVSKKWFSHSLDPTRTLTMAGGVSVCCRYDSTKCVLAIIIEHRPAPPPELQQQIDVGPVENLQDAAVKLRRLGAYVEDARPMRLLAGALEAVERAAG